MDGSISTFRADSLNQGLFDDNYLDYVKYQRMKTALFMLFFNFILFGSIFFIFSNNNSLFGNCSADFFLINQIIIYNFSCALINLILILLISFLRKSVRSNTLTYSFVIALTLSLIWSLIIFISILIFIKKFISCGNLYFLIMFYSVYLGSFFSIIFFIITFVFCLLPFLSCFNNNQHLYYSHYGSILDV